jgi:hypothetical protein
VAKCYSLNIDCPVTLQPWPQLIAWKLLPVTKALNYRLSMITIMMIIKMMMMSIIIAGID